MVGPLESVSVSTPATSTCLSDCKRHQKNTNNKSMISTAVNYTIHQVKIKTNTILTLFYNYFAFLATSLFSTVCCTAPSLLAYVHTWTAWSRLRIYRSLETRKSFRFSVSTHRLVFSQFHSCRDVYITNIR